MSISRADLSVSVNCRRVDWLLLWVSPVVAPAGPEVVVRDRLRPWHVLSYARSAFSEGAVHEFTTGCCAAVFALAVVGLVSGLSGCGGGGSSSHNPNTSYGPTPAPELPGSLVCEAVSDSHCYYAAPAGSGSECSFTSPCSIQTALPGMKRGDYLYLLDGTYSTFYSVTSGREAIINLNRNFSFASPLPTAERPVTIKAYPGHTPVIQGDYSHDRRCVVTDQSHVVFDRLKVKQCWESGIRIGDQVPVYGVTVRNSTFNEIVSADNMGGVYLLNAHDVLVEHNYFFDHYYQEYPIGTSPCRGTGMIIFRADNLTVRNNEFVQTCDGIYYKHGEPEPGFGGYTRFINNYFHDLGGNRPAISSNQNRTEIRNNLVVDGFLGLHSEDGTLAPFTLDAIIAGNTVINGRITFPHRSWGGSFPGPVRTRVEGNILFNSTYNIWTYGPDSVYDAGVGLISDNNCFYNPVGAQRIDYFSAGKGGNYTLPQWRAQGWDTHSVEADPLFVDSSGGDYHLAPGSPCARMGAYAK